MKKKSAPRITDVMPAASVAGVPIPIPHKDIPTVQLPIFVEPELPPSADRVGNLSQKERAAHKVGLTRAKLLATIITGLEATRMEVVDDNDGRQHVRTIPDLDKRLKAAEMGLKYFGDMKEQVTTTGPVTHNRVVYQWLNAPQAVSINTAFPTADAGGEGG